MINLIRLIQVFEKGGISVELNKSIETDVELDYFIKEMDNAYDEYNKNQREVIYYYGEDEILERERMNTLLPHIKDWTLVDKVDNKTTYYSKENRTVYISAPIEHIRMEDYDPDKDFYDHEEDKE